MLFRSEHSVELLQSLRPAATAVYVHRIMLIVFALIDRFGGRCYPHNHAQIALDSKIQSSKDHVSLAKRSPPSPNFRIGECSPITDSGNLDLGLTFSHSPNNQRFHPAGSFSLQLNYSTRCW